MKTLIHFSKLKGPSIFASHETIRPFPVARRACPHLESNREHTLSSMSFCGLSRCPTFRPPISLMSSSPLDRAHQLICMLGVIRVRVRVRVSELVRLGGTFPDNPLDDRVSLFEHKALASFKNSNESRAKAVQSDQQTNA